METVSNNDTSENIAEQPKNIEESFIDKLKIQYRQFAASTSKFMKRSWTRTKEITNQTIDAIKRGSIATIRFLDQINIIQVLMAIILAGIGVYFSYVEFEEQPDVRIWMYVLIFLGVVLGCFTWLYLGKRYFGKILYYVVEHKYTRKIIAGGSFSYYEYRDPDEKTIMARFTEPIGIIIVSLIALLGIAATIIGIARRLSPDLDTANPILWGVLAIVSPVIATPIIPVSLMLEDAQVKAWNAKNNTTWMVSSKYKRRLNSIISIGAIYSNLTQGINVEGITNQIEIIGGILRIGALVIFVTIGSITIFYFVFYKNYLRKLTINTLSLDVYTLELKEVEGNQFGMAKEDVVEEEMDEEPEEADTIEEKAEEESTEREGASDEEAAEAVNNGDQDEKKTEETEKEEEVDPETDQPAK